MSRTWADVTPEASLIATGASLRVRKHGAPTKTRQSRSSATVCSPWGLRIITRCRPGSDQSVGFKATHDPTDRIERRTRHLRDVVAREWQIDQHTGIDTVTGLLHQFEQRPRNPAFYLFGGQLAVLHLHFLQTRRDKLQGIDRQPWMPLHQTCHDVARPFERSRIGHRFSADRIRRAAKCGHAAKRVSRRQQTKHHLMALGRELSELHGSFVEHVERRRQVAFLKDDLPRLQRSRPGRRVDL